MTRKKLNLNDDFCEIFGEIALHRPFKFEFPATVAYPVLSSRAVFLKILEGLPDHSKVSDILLGGDSADISDEATMAFDGVKKEFCEAIFKCRPDLARGEISRGENIRSYVEVFIVDVLRETLAVILEHKTIEKALGGISS